MRILSVSELVSGQSFPKHPALSHYAHSLAEYSKIQTPQGPNNQHVGHNLEERHTTKKCSLPHLLFIVEWQAAILNERLWLRCYGLCEEHARHGRCHSNVVDDESEARMGGDLSHQWAIGAARMHILKWCDVRSKGIRDWLGKFSVDVWGLCILPR